jgi:hypothetical protein
LDWSKFVKKSKNQNGRWENGPSVLKKCNYSFKFNLESGYHHFDYFQMSESNGEVLETKFD